MRKYIKRFIHKNFLKYILIGIVATIITTFVLWILVDKLGFLAVYSNIGISATIFFVKFFMYNKSNMFDTANSRSNFWKYLGIWFLILGVSSGAFYLTVDLIHWPVVIVNPFVVVGTFLLRFMLFSHFKMLKQLD